jgi:hypothetical protein
MHNKGAWPGSCRIHVPPDEDPASIGTSPSPVLTEEQGPLIQMGSWLMNVLNECLLNIETVSIPFVNGTCHCLCVE